MHTFGRSWSQTNRRMPRSRNRGSRSWYQFWTVRLLKRNERDGIRASAVDTQAGYGYNVKVNSTIVVYPQHYGCVPSVVERTLFINTGKI